MKKILALLLIAVCCVPLCGCIQLDNYEASCAHWTDTDRTAIEYEGKTYLQTDYTEQSGAADFELNTRSLFIADPDVPLLLVETMGINGYLFLGSDVIAVYDFTRTDTDRWLYYCTAEAEAAFEAAVTAWNGQYTQFYLLDPSDYETRVPASDELNAIFTDCLYGSASNEPMSWDDYCTDYPEPYYYTLYAADDSGLFCESMSLYYADGRYAIGFYPGNNYNESVLLIDASRTAAIDAVLAELGAE